MQYHQYNHACAKCTLTQAQWLPSIEHSKCAHIHTHARSKRLQAYAQTVHSCVHKSCTHACEKRTYTFCKLKNPACAKHANTRAPTLPYLTLQAYTHAYGSNWRKTVSEWVVDAPSRDENLNKSRFLKIWAWLKVWQNNYTNVVFGRVSLPKYEVS